MLCQRVCRFNPPLIHTQVQTVSHIVLDQVEWWRGFFSVSFFPYCFSPRFLKAVLCICFQIWHADNMVTWRKKRFDMLYSVGDWITWQYCAGCKLSVAGSQNEGRQEGVKQKLSGDAGGSSAAEHSSVRAKASHFPKHCRHMACGTLKPLETKMACRS